MDIIVCIKYVPDTAEADLIIKEDRKDIKRDDLTYTINEWDNYAVEEAISIKEKVGGKVTAITLGPDEASEILRRALAMGADDAIHLKDKAFEGSDSFVTAKILSRAISKMKYDLILTGTQAEDDGCGQVGGLLAGMLGIPQTVVVNKIELLEGKVRVRRELEGGIQEVLELKLPALVAVQTGINEPRYVSIRGIRKVAGIEIKSMGIKELGFDPNEVGEAGSRVRIQELFFPPMGEGAKIIEGKPEETATKIVEILKGLGGVI
jgi:electron transfer flavoprotein beta subunit